MSIAVERVCLRTARTASVAARSVTIAAVAAALAVTAPFVRAQPAPRGEEDRERPAFRFEYVGPASAGRISAVAAIPGNVVTYYAGAASGGVWKTTDGGRTFSPIFDDQPVQAIGALAVAATDPNIVWAGTGEAWVIRPSDVMGDGVYKSVDAGKTWRPAGLRETGRIGRIVVHPRNPDVVFVCALGRATGPQEERGVYRTRDGGAHWERVLFVDRDTGCSGLAIDARNPDVLLAGTWQVVTHTWAMFSGGPGSGVHLSRDGGSTWKKLENGLPRPAIGKVDVGISAVNPRRMFALIQTANQGSLWRSDDGGEKWEAVSWDRRLIGRAGYYIRLGLSSGDENELLVASSTLWRSTDGGRTFVEARGGCGDCHDVWIDSTNPDHYVATGDGGMGITTTHGRSFTSVQLPIGQMYHVAVDDRVPYWIYSNRQDDGTMRGPSDSPVPVPNVPEYRPRAGGRPGFGTGGAAGEPGGGAPSGEEPSSGAPSGGASSPGARGGGPPSEPEPGGGGGGAFGPGAQTRPWQQGLGGCESGFTIPVPGDPEVVWASCYGNEVTRYDGRLGRARSVSPWMHTLDSEPDKLKYRCHWTPPLAIDPFEPETVYYGCQVIFRTSDRGQSWEVISPDLSTRDPSRVVPSGGVIGDNLGQFYGEVVFAIAPSPVQRGLIWAGTNDGKVWYTRDGGKNWSDVTGGLKDLPPWGTVTKIEPSHFDAATAYVVVDHHLVDARDPFIYRTTDLGKTWTRISDGLPHGQPLAYALSLAENPNRRGMLFAGTGSGFFYSADDGRTWTRFKEGLPASPVTWIEVQKRYHDVVVSTYGRGLYVLRDITPLEQEDQVSRSKDPYLYTPRPGFRLGRSGRADFTVQVGEPSREPLRLEVLDAGGAVVRTLEAKPRAGLNRVTWDLRYEASKPVELRTVAPDNPFIWREPRFRGKQTRPIVHWGIERTLRAGPLAAPGAYAVRLAGAPDSRRTFVVVKDPEIPSSDEDLGRSTLAQLRVRDAMNATAEMVNRIEVMRKQIEDLRSERGGEPAMEQALQQLDRKMLDVELMMLSRHDLHSDDKWYVEQYKLYMNLIWLSGMIGAGAGDVAGGADHRPTEAAMSVLAGLEAELEAARAAFRRLVETEVPSFNEAMKGRGLPSIGASPATSPPLQGR